MSGDTLRTVIALILLVHLIGHVQGIMAAAGLFNSETWHARSPILTDAIGEGPAKVVALVIFIAAMVLFLGAVLALFDLVVPYQNWRTLAVIGAVVSLVGQLLYWNAFAALLNRGGSLLVNVATLVLILLVHWPSDELLGR